MGSRNHSSCLPIKIGTFRFLPTGLHGLWFGFCFAGPLPLRFLLHGPLLRVHFGESLVIDYTQKSTISTLAVKLSVSAIIYPWWTATPPTSHDLHLVDLVWTFFEWIWIWKSLDLPTIEAKVHKIFPFFSLTSVMHVSHFAPFYLFLRIRCMHTSMMSIYSICFLKGNRVNEKRKANWKLSKVIPVLYHN